MPLPPPRNGHRLKIKTRPLEFSFWPVERTTRRYGLGSIVFATDPWTAIRRSTEKRCPASARDAAFALLEQAEDFYIAAGANVKAAKPLLLYYCFLNLSKALILASNQRSAVDNAHHGLSERLDPPPNNRELVNAFLNAAQTARAGLLPPAGVNIQVFDELLQVISGRRLITNPTRFDLQQLLPQVVPGHRLWVESRQGREGERFVSIERVEFWQDAPAKRIWLRIFLYADDLKRIDLGHQELLSLSRLDTDLHEVQCSEVIDGRSIICYEQINTTTYGHRPSDNIPDVIATIRHRLWRTVRSDPPYRKYYLYAAPNAEHPQVLPQILSLYAITFYLGSIVRYRPHHFDKILADEYGPFIESFLNDQPTQFLYLMASEFAQKEVTKAAIV